MPRVPSASPVRMDAPADQVRTAAIERLGAVAQPDGTLTVEPDPRHQPAFGLTITITATWDPGARDYSGLRLKPVVPPLIEPACLDDTVATFFPVFLDGLAGRLVGLAMERS